MTCLHQTVSVDTLQSSCNFGGGCSFTELSHHVQKKANGLTQSNIQNFRLWSKVKAQMIPLIQENDVMTTIVPVFSLTYLFHCLAFNSQKPRTMKNLWLVRKSQRDTPLCLCVHFTVRRMNFGPLLPCRNLQYPAYSIVLSFSCLPT